MSTKPLLRSWPASLALLFATTLAGTARGQGFDPFPAPMEFGGSAAYLPSGGAGFIPYRSGPGGGLGVNIRRVDPAMGRPTAGDMGMVTSRGMSLGRPRASITPLAPLRAMPTMGPRGAARPSMGRMTRPPVGFYPFRQPPSLVGPSSGSAMSM